MYDIVQLTTTSPYLEAINADIKVDILTTLPTTDDITDYIDSYIPPDRSYISKYKMKLAPSWSNIVSATKYNNRAKCWVETFVRYHKELKGILLNKYEIFAFPSSKNSEIIIKEVDLKDDFLRIPLIRSSYAGRDESLIDILLTKPIDQYPTKQIKPLDLINELIECNVADSTIDGFDSSLGFGKFLGYDEINLIRDFPGNVNFLEKYNKDISVNRTNSYVGQESPVTIISNLCTLNTGVYKFYYNTLNKKYYILQNNSSRPKQCI